MFPSENSQKNWTSNFLGPSCLSWAGPQGDVSKSRHFLVLEAGKGAREEREHLSRCAERLLQIQSNLRLQKTSIVEPVEAVATGRAQNFELHKVLQIFWGHAQYCARLLQF